MRMKCKDGGDCGVGGYCNECPAIGDDDVEKMESAAMKVETHKANVHETLVEGSDLIITVTDWQNLEGVNVVVTDKNLSLRFATALRHEERNALIAALAAHEAR